MIIGFHITWTTYGHWFPNDPRGSWSDEVWNPQVAAVRPLDDGRKVTRPRPVAKPELQRFLDAARSALRWETVNLNRHERAVVADAFQEGAAAMHLTICATAVLPNHVHIVVDRPITSYERLVNRLKGRSAQTIRTLRNSPPAADRHSRVPIWTQGFWCRYIDNPAYLEHAIHYVQRHPGREEIGGDKRVLRSREPPVFDNSGGGV